MTGPPVLGVRVPRQLGTRRESYTASGPPGRQLAIVLQAYDDPLAQTCVGGICTLFAGAGTRLVGVETADRQLRPTPGRTDVADLIQTEMVSAGVLSVLNAGTPKVDVWGVDDTSLIPPSHEAMATISRARGDRDPLFAEVRTSLRAAQQRHYSEPVIAMRTARLTLYGDRAGVTDQARRLQAAAAATGRSLTGFPLVQRFAGMMQSEKRIKAGRAERQKKVFLTRVLGRVHGWYKKAGGNRINIDLKKAVPLLQFWLDETGQSADEFMQNLNPANAEPAFLACKQWYDSWLSASAMETESHEFIEQLMRMSLRLEIPYFELRDFRESVAQTRDLEQLKVGLDDELGEAMATVIDGLRRPEAEALRDLEDRLELIFLMLGLAVAPREAELRVGGTGALDDALADLERLSGRKLPPALAPVVARLGPAVNAANLFLEYSRRRSRHMVERTLELMAERSEDRAMLVVGGFHARAVTRALDDYPDVSWAVLMPSVDVAAAWQQHRRRF